MLAFTNSGFLENFWDDPRDGVVHVSVVQPEHEAQGEEVFTAVFFRSAERMILERV
jgi:hypothetical protein